MNFREFTIPFDSGIFQSLRPSNILLHYFPKILIIYLSTKPRFLSLPENILANRSVETKQEICAHLWEGPKYITWTPVTSRKLNPCSRKVALLSGNVESTCRKVTPYFPEFNLSFLEVLSYLSESWWWKRTCRKVECKLSECWVLLSVKLFLLSVK